MQKRSPRPCARSLLKAPLHTEGPPGGGMSMLPEGRERRVIVLGGHITALGIVRALAPFARHIEVWDRTDKSVAPRARATARASASWTFMTAKFVSEALSTLPALMGRAMSSRQRT